MWRNKTIINLYDAPLYPRASFSSRKLQPLEHRRPYFSYFVLMGAALYCAIYVFDEISDRQVQLHPASPSLHSASPGPQHPAASVVRSAPGAPAPDMSSETVRFAQRDVPKPKKPTTVVAATPKKKGPIAAKPKTDDGMQAYASATNEWRVPYGGF